MRKFATGKYAIAFCDRCGFKVPYLELKVQIVNMKPTGLRVCDDCMDEDHPQWQVGLWPVFDPQALEHPRPELIAGEEGVPPPEPPPDPGNVIQTEAGEDLTTEGDEQIETG